MFRNNYPLNIPKRLAPYGNIQPEEKVKYLLMERDVQKMSAADMDKLGVVKSNGGVAAGLKRPLAAEGDIPSLSTVEKSLVTSKRLKTGTKCQCITEPKITVA